MAVSFSLEFKKQLKQLTDKEKDKLILRALRRDAELTDALRFELLPDVTLESVQAETEDRLHEMFNLSVSGYQLHRSLTKALGKAVKEVSRARRVTKDKQLEVDLNMYLLRLILGNYSGALNSSYSSFYKATARLAVRTTGQILKNLHEDYWVEYKPELDEFLQQLGRYDNRWQLTYELPKELEMPI